MNPLRLITFLLFYVGEVVLSNLRVAYDVLTPRLHMKPAFFALKLEQLSDRQLCLLANLITMTPGTLSVDVSSDRRFLYIHAMYAEPLEELKNSLKADFERRVRETF